MTEIQIQSAPETADAVKTRIAELFGEVCAKPDDAEVAAAADRALRDLDAILEASGD